MKIAIIDHIGNFGGSSRVLRRLLPSFIKADKNIKIDFFGSSESIERENFSEFKKLKNIRIFELSSLKLGSSPIAKKFKINKVIELLRNTFSSLFKYLPNYLSGNLKKELEGKIINYDLVYFPWPFLIELPNLRSPIFATFHDFNYKYYFSGTPIYSKKRTNFLNKQIPLWLKRTTPIVSNYYIKNEIVKFYPKFKNKINIINLAPYSKANKKTSKNNYGNYILYPTNLASHKNLGPLIVSMSYLSKKIKNLKLILTGPNTEIIKGKATKIGLEYNEKDVNIEGLGYVSNQKIEELIKNARVVVSSSLYEADNGPCTDAWINGIPVAMANIPSNIEHIKTQGVFAEIFDPFNPKDIYKKIYKIISNEKKYKKLAKTSSKNISNFTWDKVGKEYFDLFKKKT